MATAPTYCTHRQLKDVFPQVDSFDNKRALYGWESLGNNIYISRNTGLATQLFQDGKELSSNSAYEGSGNWTATINQDLVANPLASAGGYSWVSYSSFSSGSEDDIKVGQYLVTSANTEKMFIESIDTTNNNIEVIRGALGSTIQAHDVGETITEWLEVNASNVWYYDSYFDHCILYSTTDPNDLLMEAGEDFSTLITRTTGNASRYLDAKLDPNLPKEQLKDKEGNFDYIIVRTTALIAATFMIRAHDPTSEVANALMEDAMGNVDALNKGGAALSWQTTGDSSKGVIRDVGTISGALRPVDTRGRWSGSFDVIKVKIIDAGAIGTATYSVWTKGNDKLGVNEGNQVVTAETIDGDYQALAGGLQIRFGGSAYDSTASANDTWEIEVAGWQEEVDNSAVNSVRMTRR